MYVSNVIQETMMYFARIACLYSSILFVTTSMGQAGVFISLLFFEKKKKKKKSTSHHHTIDTNVLDVAWWKSTWTNG